MRSTWGRVTQVVANSRPSRQRVAAITFALLLVSSLIVVSIPINADISVAATQQEAEFNPPVPAEAVDPGQTVVVPTQTPSGETAFTIVGANGTETRIRPDSQPSVLGPTTRSLWGSYVARLPYVESGTGALKVATETNSTETVLPGNATVTPKRSKTTLAVGRWNTSAPTVLFVDAEKDRIYRVDESGNVTAVADPANGAQAVAGVGDIDGDGQDELVFADGSQAIRYIEPSESGAQTFSKVYDGAGSNDGIGVGAPADFDGDGVDSVPIVDGSNQIRLVTAGAGGRTLTGGIAAKAPVAPGDVDRDGTIELAFYRTDGDLAYIDDVATDPVSRDISGPDQPPVTGDGLGVALSNERSILDRKETDVLTDASASLQKRWAQLLLLNLRAEGTESRYDGPLNDLNQSIELTTPPSRIDDRQAFTYDRSAVEGLAFTDYRSRNAKIVLEAQLIASAANETAVAQLAYARWAFNRTESDLSPEGRRAAETSIANASEALARSQRQVSESPGWDLESRQAAIDNSSRAWAEATAALERIDTETEPEVTVTTRRDPVRDGSESVTGQIRVDVFDIQPYELSDATVTIGDDRTTTAPVNVTDRRSNASVRLNVTLEKRVTSVDVAVEDINERSEAATQVGRADSDTVRFDGDGVPDFYETETLGTDPQDPDSDSPKMSTDTADDGTIDGREDFDDDSLSNYHEGIFRTDPFDSDSDGDTLSDSYEVQYPRLNQTAATTNGTAPRDPDWDPDGDGLDVSQERALGTHPFVADTDADGLSDDRERGIGTDPTDSDTDDDGIPDGEEVELGTDPLSADSDGNGTPDGRETYRTSTTNQSLGVTVTTTGSGNTAGNVTIQNGSLPTFQRDSVESAQVTSWVNLESERPIDGANVTFDYDESELGATDESDLVVFRYNETAAAYEPLDTTVDVANDTVTGRTDQFSRFVVFDVRNWASNFVADRPDDVSTPDGDTDVRPLDTVFVIDSSGSMGSNDPDELRKTAAKEFVGALLENDRAGVVDFDGSAYVAQSLTTDFQRVNESIEALDANGGTNIGAGVGTANDEFAAESNASRAKVGILLTDGIGNGGRSEARTAADRNITIYTIGFGDANGEKLRDIANITGGNYTFVEDERDLPEVFARVAEDVTGGQDSDGDGIPDRREIEGVPTGSGVVQTDPTAADTDGDGLTDGEELGEPKTVTELRGEYYGDVILDTLERAGYTPENASERIYVDPDSDPTMVDTDGDDLDDLAETTGQTTVARTTDKQATQAVLSSGEPSASTLEGAFDPITVSSDPQSYDTDGDGLFDGREHTLGTDPTGADTDGDGIADPDELETENDPTLYDVRRPEVSVRSARYDVPSAPSASLEMTYSVELTATDAAGIARLELRKDGETGASKSLNPDANRGETVRRRLTFTDGIETQDVKTDSVTSTFTTTIGAAGDAVSGVGGKVADATLGTTVYMRAIDGNGNQRRGIAIEQSNFYGEVAGDVITGNDFIDDEVAERFGKVSGFSASVGVLFRDISEIVDDPTAFIDGITALYGLVREEGAGVAGTITELLIEEIERKQARNNPYGDLDSKEYPELYDTYRSNYYAGYSAGFLAKLVVTAGAGKAAKSTIKNLDRVNSVATRLKRTRAVRALARVDSAKQAAKARTVARIMLAGDRAVEPVVSQARTAGRAFRVWRIQRSIDADVDALPASKQQDLGRFLARTGGDGRRTYADLRAVDSDAADTLAAIDDPVTQRQFVNAYERGEVDSNKLAAAIRRYDELDAEGKETADDLIAATGDEGVEFVSEANGETIRVLADGSGDIDDAYDQSVVRAADSDDINNNQLKRAVQKIDGLSGERKRRAKQLVADAGPNGAKLVDELDDESLENLLTINVDGASTNTLRLLRENLAELNGNDVSTSRIREFIQNTKQLSGSDNAIEGVDDLVRTASKTDSGSFSGPAAEAEFASDNIDTVTAVRRDIKTPPAGRPGDIDAVENVDGAQVGSEVKNSGRNTNRQDVGQIAKGYEELIQRGEVDEYQIVFRELSNPDIRKYMEDNDIPYTVINED